MKNNQIKMNCFINMINMKKNKKILKRKLNNKTIKKYSMKCL